MFTVELLSRIQFALTVAFHYIYPPMTIGLGVLLVCMEGAYLKTKNPIFHHLAHFWTKIFGLIFSIGVATGIVMEFEFGTNWASYSRFVGDIFGSALAAEGIFAFFLESGFLALLLFGWDRVSSKMHFFATCMVSLGAHFSAIWIVVANSWMQTPAGYHLERIIGAVHTPLPNCYIVQSTDIGHVRAVVDNFWDMVLNPSSLERLTHVVLAAWLTGGFLVISISAWYLLKKIHIAFAQASMKIAITFVFVTSILQMISADVTARGVAKHQPIKLAAMEGVFHTQSHAPFSLCGYVDVKNQQVHGIQIPGLLSWLVFHDASRPIPGLLDMPNNDFIYQHYPQLPANQLSEKRKIFWPLIGAVFQTYHLMVLIGTILFLLSFFSFFMLISKKIFDSEKSWVRGVLWILVFSVFGPQICNQAGWFTAELGRQPWIVYNLLLRSDGLSRAVQAEQVLFSIILFLCIYILLFMLFIYLLNRKIQHGPIGDEGHHTKAIMKSFNVFSRNSRVE